MPREPLSCFNLESIGYPISIYSHPLAVTNTFILQHYAYQATAVAVKAQPGDYVIDAGGCWGDTAIYFAHEVGAGGKVYTFEFVPDNLEIMRKTFELNPQLSAKIEIITNPLGETSGSSIFSSNKGPSSRLSNARKNESDLEVTTESIDNFVNTHDIPRVDFIKMDIEGAELEALRGARKTIETFRPKLAISLYHSINDFITIPKYLASLNYGYKFFLDHITIHSEETVLFAKPE